MTTKSIRLFQICAFALALTACGGGSPDPDAGPVADMNTSADMSAVNPDASPTVDLGVLGDPDAGSADAGGSDAGVQCCFANDPADDAVCAYASTLGYNRCIAVNMGTACTWPVVNADCPM